MSSMNRYSPIELAQAAIAQGINNDEVLSARAKPSRLAKIMSAGSAKMVITAAVMAAAVAGMGVSKDANAQQQWSPYASTVYGNAQGYTVNDRQAQRDRERAEREAIRAEREAERQAARTERERRNAQERSARVMGNTVGDVVANSVYNNGDRNTARQAGRAANDATRASMSNDRLSRGEGAALGSAVGGAIGAVGAKDSKSRGQQAAVGGLLGAIIGYGATVMTEPKAEPAPTVVPTQPQVRGIAAPAPAPVSYGAQGARQLVVHDAAQMGLPPIMVEVARAGRTGIVEPGSKPVNMGSPADFAADPLLDRVIKSMASTSSAMADRASLLSRLEDMRADGASSRDIGNQATSVARADKAFRESLLTTMDMINKASAVGGYDTREIWRMTGEMVSEGYTPDARASFKPNQRVGYNLN